MLEKIPTQSNMTELIGKPLFQVWEELCAAIDEKYNMDKLLNSGGKKWTHEYKYRRGGGTLCTLYAKKDCIGFMVIFGKGERAITMGVIILDCVGIIVLANTICKV